jgi:hypothetical protein
MTTHAHSAILLLPLRRGRNNLIATGPSLKDDQMMKDQLPVLDLGLQRYKAEILQGRTFKLKRVNIVESHPSRSLGAT